MAINFPGPYGIEVLYNTNDLDHTMLINVDVSGTAPTVGTSPLDIDLKTQAGGTVSLHGWVTLLVNELQPFFDSSDSLVSYDFWKYDTDSFERTWITGGTIGDAGTSAGTEVDASQLTFSFRTSNGGIAYLKLMETTYDSSVVKNPPFTDQNFIDLTDFCTATSSPMTGRDDGFLVTPLRLSQGKNEAIFKIRFR